MSLLGNEDLFEAAVEVLLESMQQASWTRYQTYRNDLLNCFTSDDMKKKFTIAIAGKDSNRNLNFKYVLISNFFRGG